MRNILPSTLAEWELSSVTSPALLLFDLTITGAPGVPYYWVANRKRVVRGTNVYEYYPFQIALPDEGGDVENSRVQLVLSNADKRFVPYLTDATMIRATLRLVREGDETTDIYRVDLTGVSVSVKKDVIAITLGTYENLNNFAARVSFNRISAAPLYP